MKNISTILKKTIANRTIFLLAIVLVTSIFFSFYKLENFFHFGYDQERDYQVVKNIVSNHKLTLIGPRAVASTGFYLGPWYYYFLVPFYVLFGGNPIFLAYVAGFVHVLTDGLLFYTLKKYSKPVAAFCGTIIWSSLLHRMSWNVMFVPLITLLLFNLLSEKITFKKLCLSAFLVSLGINFHFQLVFLIPLTIWLMFLNHQKILTSPKHYIFIILAFILPFLPLIFFDLRHQLINVKSFISFSDESVSHTTNFINQMKFSITQLVRSFGFVIPGKQFYQYFYLIGIIILFAFTLLKNIRIRRLFPWLSVPLISLLALTIYSTPVWPEYYHLTATVVLLIMFVVCLSQYRIGLLLLLVITSFDLYIASSNLVNHNDAQGYNHKKDLMLFILSDSAPNRPNINYDFPYGQGLGFGSIREFYEDKSGKYGTTQYFVGFNYNQKHFQNKKGYGAYAVSFKKQ